MKVKQVLKESLILMSEDKKCFIIMPISTPEDMVETYRDRKVHFLHVLDCLFIPSAQQAIYPNRKETLWFDYAR